MYPEVYRYQLVNVNDNVIMSMFDTMNIDRESNFVR